MQDTTIGELKGYNVGSNNANKLLAGDHLNIFGCVRAGLKPVRTLFRDARNLLNHASDVLRAADDLQGGENLMRKGGSSEHFRAADDVFRDASELFNHASGVFRDADDLEPGICSSEQAQVFFQELR